METTLKSKLSSEMRYLRNEWCEATLQQRLGTTRYIQSRTSARNVQSSSSTSPNSNIPARSRLAIVIAS